MRTFIISIFLILSACNYSNQEKEKVAQPTPEEQTINYFQLNRDSIISSLKEDMKNGEYYTAYKESKRYLITEDDTVKDISEKAKNLEEQKILAQLKNIPEREYSGNLALYNRLYDMYPDNKIYTKKREYYLREKEKDYAIRASSKWEISSFVDDFGEKTGDNFIWTHAEGTFSNSATKDSYLYAELLVTPNKAALYLHEYRKNNPAVKFIGGGVIAMKNSAGKTIHLRRLSDWNTSGGIKIRDVRTLREFLKESTGKIKAAVKDKYSSTYKFTIDTEGYKYMYEKI